MQAFVNKLLVPSLNWLAVFAPLALVLEIAHHAGAPWARPIWIFVASALAIIPAAGWMGEATEHLGARLGERLGGLLNATFGNAAEFIIAGMALYSAARSPGRAATMHSIVKASLTGSIIGNVLLVFGAAAVVGGFRHPVQRFSKSAARTNTTLLWLATVGLLIPAFFRYAVHAATDRLHDLSLEFSLILLVVYGFSLVFAFWPSARDGDVPSAPTEQAVVQSLNPWSLSRSVTVLLAATALIAVLAEFMVGSVHEASETLGLTDLFVGVIVVAIVGNAAEHGTAVQMAWRNRIELSVSIAVGSSIQIAMFVAPVLVLLSYAFGAPMDLVFTGAEIVSVAVSVLIIGQIANDGETNWLEGVMLLAVYIMLGILFFYLPSPVAR